MTPEQIQKNKDNMRYGNKNIDRNLDYLTAKKLTFKKIRKITPYYLIYFFVTTYILISIYGEINYGPNKPYALYLLFVGFPYIILFLHMIIIAEKQGNRIAISSTSQYEKSTIVSICMTIGVFFWAIVYFLYKFFPKIIAY